MSWDALSWAVRQGRVAGKALGPAGRLLLIHLAERTNRDTGYTFVSPRTLAEEDCGVSIDTVKDWLRKLEQLGLLARIKQVRPDGSHGVSLIVLLVDEEASRRALALGWERADEAQDVGGWGNGSPTPHEEGVGENPQGGGGKNTPPILEPENITQSPLTPTAAAEPQPEGRAPALAVVPKVASGFDRDEAGARRFLEAWPSGVLSDTPAAIGRLWARLSDAERREAAARAADWLRQAKAAGIRTLSARRYLADKGWQAIDAIRTKQKAGVVAAPQHFVWEGSDAWRAWLRHSGKASFPLSTHEGKRGWWFPSLYPPRDGPARGADSDQDVARHLGA